VELACDEREALLALDRSVQALELVGDPVETLEECVELAISDVVLFHGAEVYGRFRRSARVRTTSAPGPVCISPPDTDTSPAVTAPPSPK